MGAPAGWRRRAPAGAVVAVGVVGLCWVAGATRPFTDGADTVTVVGFAVMVAVAAVALRHAAGSPRAGGSARAWYVVAVLALGWELAVYVAGWSGRRAEFPTLSSLGDTLGHWHAGRAAMFAVWLGLGWALFWQRLPSRRGRGGTASGSAPADGGPSSKPAPVDGGSPSKPAPVDRGSP